MVDPMGEEGLFPQSSRSKDNSGNTRPVLIGAVVLLMLSLLCSRSRAQSGPELMQKMIGAYQRLTDYSGQANVDQIIATANGRTLNTEAISVTMRVKRPNKLALIISNAGPTGTHSVYSDGRTLTVYDALPNHYTSGPTAPSLQTMLPLLRQRAHVDAELDPLYFISVNRLPPTVTGLQAAGSATVNGHPCFIVTGLARAAAPASPQNRANLKGIRSSSMHWTWYIDKGTFLLAKAEARSNPITVQAQVREGGKVVRKPWPIVIVVRNTIVTAQTGLSLADAQFTFKAPKGATEQKPQSALVGGGR